MRPPTRVADRHGFDTIVDARSPAEFALDHIPGAINCPVLDDEERRIVGTLYKQQGAFEARRVGGGMVAANLARHLQNHFADRPAGWKPLVYCWRGGLRSGSMTTWLRMVGWDAQQLAGGYKSWRRHVIDTLEQQAPQLPLVVVCGPTGSAKTRVLHALAHQGHQTLDLEGLARHKGSLLGALPDTPQPSQTAFETAIAAVVEGCDPARPLYVEGEGRRIGRLDVPIPLVERMRDSPCVELQVPAAARLEYLLRDYAYLGDRPEWLAGQFEPLKQLHGKDVIARWQALALAGTAAAAVFGADHAALRPLVREIAARPLPPVAGAQAGASGGAVGRRYCGAGAGDRCGCGLIRMRSLGCALASSDCYSFNSKQPKHSNAQRPVRSPKPAHHRYAVIFRSTMIFFHLAASAATIWPNWGGVDCTGSIPSRANLSRVAVSARAWLAAALTLATSSAGRPRGP